MQRKLKNIHTADYLEKMERSAGKKLQVATHCSGCLKVTYRKGSQHLANGKCARRKKFLYLAYSAMMILLSGETHESPDNSTTQLKSVNFQASR